MRPLRIASTLLSLVPAALPAQSATPAPTAFLTTIGKDTFCLEQYTRAGNVISGSWVVMHPPGVFVHDSLPASRLDRFVGSYSLGTTTIPITRDGEHLVLHLPQQPVIQLLAMSPTEFFVRKPNLVLAFESDSTGRVTGLTVQQLEMRQRFVRSN